MSAHPAQVDAGCLDAENRQTAGKIGEAAVLSASTLIVGRGTDVNPRHAVFCQDRARDTAMSRHDRLGYNLPRTPSRHSSGKA